MKISSWEEAIDRERNRKAAAHDSVLHDLKECQAEIRRHHKDFGEISRIVNGTLRGLREGYEINLGDAENMLEALKQIRRIVG